MISSDSCAVAQRFRCEHTERRGQRRPEAQYVLLVARFELGDLGVEVCVLEGLIGALLGYPQVDLKLALWRQHGRVVNTRGYYTTTAEALSRATVAEVIYFERHK